MSVKTCAAPTCRTSLDEYPVTCPHSLAFCGDCVFEETCALCGFDAIAQAAEKPPSITIHRDVTQGTEEWYDQRRGIVTASAVGRLVTRRQLGPIDYNCPACGAKAKAPCLSKTAKEPKPIKTLHPERTAPEDAPYVLAVAEGEDAYNLTATLASERVNGFTDPTYMNSDMWRGVEDEPRAVEVYAKHYDTDVQMVGFMVRDDWGFPIGYSPDGLVGEEGLIEVKSRRSKTQFLHIINGEIPTANMAQLQCGLLVSGRKWIDYVSFAGGMHMWVKRVYPDPSWFRVIVAAVAQFEDNAAEMVSAYNNATTGLAMTERPTELEMVI